MTTKTRAEQTTLENAEELLYWTLVDAIEMNPESAHEIESAWQLITNQLRSIL